MEIHTVSHQFVCKMETHTGHQFVARYLLLNLGFGTQLSVETDDTLRIRFFPSFYTEVQKENTRFVLQRLLFFNIVFRRLTCYFIRIAYFIQFVSVRRADYPLEQRLIRILLFPLYIVFFPPFLANLISHQYVYGNSQCQ